MKRHCPAKKAQYAGSALVQDLPKIGVKPLKHIDGNRSATFASWDTPANLQEYNLLSDDLTQAGSCMSQGTAAYQRNGNTVIVKEIDVGIVGKADRGLEINATYTSLADLVLPRKWRCYVVLDKFPNEASAIPDVLKIFQQPDGASAAAQAAGDTTYVDAAHFVRDTDQRKRFEMLAVHDIAVPVYREHDYFNETASTYIRYYRPECWAGSFKVPVHKRVRFAESDTSGGPSKIQENAIYLYIVPYGYNQTYTAKTVTTEVRARAHFTD